jgi:hypothetical protein
MSTGESVRGATVSVVECGDRPGIPEYTRLRVVIETLGVDSIVQTIQHGCGATREGRPISGNTFNITLAMT